MKVKATPLINRSKKNPPPPAWDACRKLELEATNPQEQHLLAMLSRVLADSLCLKHTGNMVRLAAFLKTQVPEIPTT